MGQGNNQHRMATPDPSSLEKKPSQKEGHPDDRKLLKRKLLHPPPGPAARQRTQLFGRGANFFDKFVMVSVWLFGDIYFLCGVCLALCPLVGPLLLYSIITVFTYFLPLYNARFCSFALQKVRPSTGPELICARTTVARVPVAGLID